MEIAVGIAKVGKLGIVSSGAPSGREEGEEHDECSSGGRRSSS